MSTTVKYDSQLAVQKFKREFKSPCYKRVVVYKNNSELFDFPAVKISILIEPYPDKLLSVNIPWEDVGLIDYKAQGLFGFYACSYCEIEFNDEILKIIDKNGIKIVLI